MNINTIDLKILAALQSDARQTNQALADKVGLSPTPCLRRVKKLEDDGIIEGYKALINRKKMGLGLTVFVTVKVERHQDREAEKFVSSVTHWPEVVSCHLVSGDMDYLMEVATPDIDGYEKFVLKRLLKHPSVKDVRSNFVMRTHKRDGSLPLPSPK